MDKKFDEKIIERLCNKIDNDNKKLGFKWKKLYKPTHILA